MTPSKIFLYFCLFFVGGIFLSSFFFVSQPVLLTVLILGILLISVLWKYKRLVVIGFCILFLIFGIWRYQQAELEIINDELRKFNDLDQSITLIGVVREEPDIRASNTKLIIKVEEISLSAIFHDREISPKMGGLGKVLVTTRIYPQYQYGDKLKITGKLKTPQELEDFNYKDYLKKDGIYSAMYWPEIELLERESYTGLPGVIYAKILSFKNKLRESIYQNLSPPQSSILGAMILGDKRKLSEDLKTKLNIAGVRHITAISGLHVTILTSILMTLLIGLGFWRQQAFLGSIILIALFIIMTGLQPSAIRAGIMGGLFLFGQYLGRMSLSSRSIVFAASLMLIQNPLLLKFDAGFQLSFLAMMGIIYLMPIFQDYFFKWFPLEWFQKRWWLSWFPIKTLGGILAMTLAAQIFTLPILIYNFGYISLIAPLTNVLIVPILPFIIGLGFLFGLAGIIWQSLGWILSWLAWLPLTYTIRIVDWFSAFPYLTFKISWLWLIFLYLILGLITWRLQKTQRLKLLQY